MHETRTIFLREAPLPAPLLRCLEEMPPSPPPRLDRRNNLLIKIWCLQRGAGVENRKLAKTGTGTLKSFE